MSARVVAVTSLLIDLLDDLGPKEATDMTPSEFDLALLLLPLMPDLQQLRRDALDEMGALAGLVLAV